MADKKTLSHGIFCLGLALGLALVWPSAWAFALSVEWKNLSGRERVIIRLDASDGRIGGVARNSPTSIGLPFTAGSRNFAMAAPGTAKLFAGIESAPGGLSVKLKSAEFGYIVTRPSANLLHLDIYPDPLGKRWKKAAPKAPAKAEPKPAPAAPKAAEPAPAEPGKAPTADKTADPGKLAEPSKAVEPNKTTEPGKAAEPSSVFSGTLTPPQAPSQAPPAAGPKTGAPPPPPQPGRMGSGLEEGDNYRLPEWPPLEMPRSLPAPPPPPASNPGASLWPPVAPQSVSHNETGGALSVLAGGSAAHRLSWRDFLPFAAVAQAASPSVVPPASPPPSPPASQPASPPASLEDDAEYQVIEAPFAYRARLNVADEPNWVEQSVPVYIRVPKGMSFAVQADAVPRAGTQASPMEQPEPLPPLSEASGSAPPVDSAPPSAPGATSAATPAPVAAPPATAASEPGSPAASGEAEPEQQAGIARAVPAPPASSGVAVPEGPVLYVDEQGNPVPPPLDPATALREVDRKINDGDLASAVETLNRLLGQHNLSREQRGIALHRRADAVFSLYENDLAANFQIIYDTSTQAINYNTKSPRNAAAYLRLGYTNLKAGNAYEAAGYFNVLRREYPHYENVPLTYYYWGDYQYSQGNLNEAAEQFNYIVNNYPEHPISRDAALGLSRSYYRMGAFEDAFKIMLFVEQRWPNFYLDYPPMLSMLGDVAYRVGNLDKARSAYWLYYNLTPYADDADMVLTRLGDIYMAGKFHSAAVQVYGEAVKRFPSKDGGIIALMRLAEDGVYDEPTMRDMIKVFDRPYDKRPAEAYRTIIREYPGNPLVTLAKLKLAMWTLWQKDYLTVLDLCSEIVGEAPSSPLAQRARDVAMNAFTLLAAADTNDKRYNRAREVWERYPILQTQAEFLDPESRLALAVSQWNSGYNTEALTTLEPFFYGAKAGEISEMALFLALNIMTEHFQWERIEELAQRVELWELTPQAQNQLNYALALGYENMDKQEAAAPLWSSIYAAKLLPPTQLANSSFYLARAAERQRDLERAYHIGQEALKLLLGVQETDREHADLEKIKTQLMSLVDIAESSGVLEQALDYARQYMQYVNEGSLDQQSVMYRIARIHKKRGDTADWLRILEDLADKYANSVFGKTAKSELSAYRLGSEAQRFSNTQF